MSGTLTKEKRVVAIDPTTKGYGFAVMEGPERLIDWGVKGVKNNKNENYLEPIADLINQYQPDVLVVEDFAGRGSRRCKRVQELITRIIKLGSEKKVHIRNFSPLSVRKAFSDSGTFTKHQIATAIAQRLPELAPRLPPFRKCWMSEDYRMSIFDAVSFALTFFYFGEKRNGPH
jgi:Holliday junction resolvasome RuvABC endonuclease subunit